MPNLVCTPNGAPVSSASISVALRSAFGTQTMLGGEVHAPADAPAPTGFWMDITPLGGFNIPAAGPIYKPAFHDITYTTTITRPGGSASTFSTSLNMPTAWNNRNIYHGPQVSFVLDTPGAHTITVTALDKSGNAATMSFTITVQNPDTLYAGNRTILVDPANVGDAATYPGSQVRTTLDLAVTALNSLGTTGRILVKRGTTHNNVALTVGSSAKNFRMGAYGTGARPIIWGFVHGVTKTNKEIFRFSNSSPVKDFCIHDLDLRGYWNAATMRGDPRNHPLYWLTHSGASAPAYVVHKVSMDGFVSVNTSNQSAVDSLTIFSECFRTNWQDYGFFGHDMSDGRLGFIGCSVVQNPNACYNGGKDGWGNDHGPLRNSRTVRVYVGACDFFSLNGWSSGGGGAITGIQPCIRPCTDGIDGRFWSVERAACESGHNTFVCTGASGNYPNAAGNFLFDRMLVVGSAVTSGEMVDFGHGGITLRNAYFLLPPVKRLSVGLQKVIKVIAESPSSTTYTAPIKLYNNTFFMMQPSSANADRNPIFTDAVNDWGSLFFSENNITYTPYNAVSPNVADEPFSMPAITGFTPRFIGLRAGPARLQQAITSGIANGGTVTFNYPAGFTQADFAPGNGHALTLSKTEHYFEDRGQIAMSFGPTTITITNTSGDLWPSGKTIILNLIPTNPVTDTSFATPTTGLTYLVPQSGSPAYRGSTTGNRAVHDYWSTVRPTGPDTRGAFYAV